MWGISNGVGFIGPCLDAFTAGTWMIAGRLRLSEQPFQLKVCIFAGLAYGVVETLHSLAMKHDLACECETEEWYEQMKARVNLPYRYVCISFICPFLLLSHVRGYVSSFSLQHRHFNSVRHQPCQHLHSARNLDQLVCSHPPNCGRNRERGWTHQSNSNELLVHSHSRLAHICGIFSGR